MHCWKAVAYLVALGSMTACGGVEAEGGLGAQKAALTTGTSLGCTFTAAVVAKPGPFPPIYDVKVTRDASPTCPWGASTVVVGSGTGAVPTAWLVANDLGVAVSYTFRTGGPSAQQVGLKNLAPDTLAVVRSTGLRTNALSTYIYSGDLAIAPDGTTLTVSGTKNAPLVGETGSGSNYVATFPDFFTTETAPSIVAF
ncbi:hypothetical protein DRW03_13400 [Corallococcus sp. H22C18031201]|uniref:hypothetical protein n=1 Tax=Citreicoccus inhibens TaxID=2849499 RepID=UPI000E73FCE0|nr:hypothetical protein [Citreicoccus inhibens]MBU8893980.1 hypothetical protein [Citreicoccus inhibens]RJS23291.1 hypothetical protein DRW03_13400 [Corallococcus sp. H22C18031201]